MKRKKEKMGMRFITYLLVVSMASALMPSNGMLTMAATEEKALDNTKSAQPVGTEKIKFDSKDIDFKDPYGAVEEGKDVKFTIQTGAEHTGVKLIIKGPNSKEVDMEEESGDSSEEKKWTYTIKFDKAGCYQYYFEITSGSSVYAYADDASMDYGVGTITDLEHVNPYDLIVYKESFTTPDWMKNAIVYQIVPDRFNNGDKNNDEAQLLARGTLRYEFPNKWYTYPENPDMEKLAGYPDNAYSGDGQYGNEIYGGDVKGIIDRRDYLKELGVTAIYLTPICSSVSDYKRDASDYMKLDPILGDIADFHELVKVAEENNMHIILDGVFNHVSDDSVYFDRYYKHVGEDGKVGAYPYWAYVYDYMEEINTTLDEAEKAAKIYFQAKGVTDFTYTKWFTISNDSMTDNGETVNDACGERVGKPVYSYNCLGGDDAMPAIKATNGSEYQTKEWADAVIKNSDCVVQYWLYNGANGWKVDTADGMFAETSQQLRESVKSLNSDAVIIGDSKTDVSKYLLGDMYDSAMNYEFREAVLDYVKDGNLTKATAALEKLRELYPPEAFYAMMNFLGSEDTTRILSRLDRIAEDQKDQTGDDAMNHAFPTYENTSNKAKELQYVASFIQMTYAGAPMIYYGDEIGMTGADTPDNRRAMAWGKGNRDLVNWYATLAKIRSQYEALRTGSVKMFDVNDAVMAYVRSDGDAKLAVMVNKSDKPIKTTIDLESLGMEDGSYTDVINNSPYLVKEGKTEVTIPAYRGSILLKTTKVKATSIDTSKLEPAYDAKYIVGGGDENSEMSEPTNKPEVPNPTNTPEVPGPSNSPNGSKSISPTNVPTISNSPISIATQDPTQAVSQPKKKGTVLKTQTGKFTVTSTSKKAPQVVFTTSVSKKTTKVTIPASIVMNGITYKVTGIAKNAFRNNKKIKSISIGSNVKTIEAGAFYGAKNLQTIIIKSSVLKKIGANAFKNISKKAIIKVPAKKLKLYKKLLMGKGKNLKIKKIG